MTRGKAERLKRWNAESRRRRAGSSGIRGTRLDECLQTGGRSPRQPCNDTAATLNQPCRVGPRRRHGVRLVRKGVPALPDEPGKDEAGASRGWAGMACNKLLLCLKQGNGGQRTEGWIMESRWDSRTFTTATWPQARLRFVAESSAPFHAVGRGERTWLWSSLPSVAGPSTARPRNTAAGRSDRSKPGIRP